MAAACLTLAAVPAAARADLAQYVDPMVGTAPPGFTVPGAAAPFGMVQNSPDTTGEFAYSGYLATDPVIRGFSLVHLSGPGVKKAGDIPFMPFTGEAPPRQDPHLYASTWNRATERAEAGYYSVFLDRPATTVELTASTRTAMQRYTFPPSPRAGLLIDVKRRIPGAASGSYTAAGDTITGSVSSSYPVFFVARFSRPFDSKGDGWVGWDTTSARTITMRVGISFVDLEGARRNLEAEAPAFDFDAMRVRTRAAWNRELGKIRVSGGNLLDRRSFYTALYHAQLHPNVFSDVDGRYLGMDDQIHSATGRTQYANFSLWDTYKGQNQLLAVIQPARYREMLLSLLADYREDPEHKLPRWAEQNTDPAHMSGDPAIPMIADGVCRGVLGAEDAAALYEASVATVARREAEMRTLGYLPLERSSRGAGTTLEYGTADFALALLADAVGQNPRPWVEDSLRYRRLLDPSTGFIRPRNADGSWLEPFSTTEETGFQEGNSWQYSWLAPHDARGLFDRMGAEGRGGEAEVVRRLDHFFSLPSEAQNRVTFFGLAYRFDQYAPGNEHDLQAPWMYPFAGEPWKTGRELSDLRILFRPTVDGLPGNDDLGGLSGWYVWSTLGFGPVTPGAPFYVFGSPQWDRVAIRSGTRRIVVTGGGTYVRGARLGRKRLDRAWFTHRELVKGGTLALDAGASPDRSFGAAERPPSVSDSKLSAFGCAA